MARKRYRVVFSPQANLQLQDILEYYNQISKNLSQKIGRKIVEVAQSLESLPNSKPILPNTDHLGFYIRYAKAWNYKVLFEVLEEKDMVSILSIRHDKEDPLDIVDKIK